MSTNFLLLVFCSLSRAYVLYQQNGYRKGGYYITQSFVPVVTLQKEAEVVNPYLVAQSSEIIRKLHQHFSPEQRQIYCQTVCPSLQPVTNSPKEDEDVVYSPLEEFTVLNVVPLKPTEKPPAVNDEVRKVNEILKELYEQTTRRTVKKEKPEKLLLEEKKSENNTD